MEFLYEKIAYLKGLADGLEVKDDTREGKMFNALMDVIEEIADSMSDMVEYQDEVNEYLDLLDEDLSIVEEELFGDLELYDEDYEYDDDDDYDFDFDGDDDDEFADEFHIEDHPCDCSQAED